MASPNFVEAALPKSAQNSGDNGALSIQDAAARLAQVKADRT